MGTDETSEVESGSSTYRKTNTVTRESESILAILVDIGNDLRMSRRDAESQKKSQLKQCRDVFAEQAPRLRRSLAVMSSDLIDWMNRGGPWRPFVVLTGGTITSIILTGIVLFLLFFITATVSVVTVGLLGSIAAAGAVIAVFFTALCGIYIAAIAISTCVVSSVVFFTVVTALTVSGSIAFWWLVWMGTARILQVAQNSLTFTVSTLHNVSGAVHTRTSQRKKDR